MHLNWVISYHVWKSSFIVLTSSTSTLKTFYPSPFLQTDLRLWKLIDPLPTNRDGLNAKSIILSRTAYEKYEPCEWRTVSRAFGHDINLF